ncbi:class I SAM-dependent methyltransferase [uncultured Sulfitobacter sp.]|uniref:class I SAM-dependent DNA methyltransferase n=1 Tax=uncultured Sulfitobacter sp. TaxID=191468 RepID=UPI0026200BCC|nr:class I SAM-dependent methyltransferase [uncultured Sulfitobacter sp.]
MSIFLDQAFVNRDHESTRKFYNTWAPSYDAEITAAGYVTPTRCAEALASHTADLSAPILDFGCGSGLSGQAFKDVGFTQIDGVDLAPAMIEQARAKDIYRSLSVIEADATPKGQYAVISAVGVIGLGAAPSTTIDVLMYALPKGGKLVFSFNDHALADPTQTGRLNEWIDCSAARVLFAEYGAHLLIQNMNSTVYVIEKY